MPVWSTNAARAAPPPDHHTPLPATIAGRAAPWSNAAACSINAGGAASARCSRQCEPGKKTSDSSTSEWMTSIGISRYTGPGRPVVASLNAAAMYSGIRSTWKTRRAHLVTGCTISSWSIVSTSPMSWPRTVADPAMHTNGDPLVNEVAMPVTALVRPGPAVTMHTPGSPVARAHPSAAYAAAPSWRTSIRRMPTLGAAAHVGSMWPPPSAKRCVTPSSRNARAASIPPSTRAITASRGRKRPR